MKAVIIFACLFAVALAHPIKDTSIINLSSDVGPNGYAYNLDTDDGTHHNEDGHLENAGTENEAISVRGSYSFIADDGNSYTVNYVADENGFQPKGAHLPTGAQ